MGDRVQCSLIGREGAGIRNSRAHVNGIENFWGIAKTWLVKFRGIRKDTFCLHLKRILSNEKDTETDIRSRPLLSNAGTPNGCIIHVLFRSRRQVQLRAEAVFRRSPRLGSGVPLPDA